MLSPIHVLLGEEFQDWALPLITACMDAHALLALRATCRDGRRAATAEYDPVEAHQFFNGGQPISRKRLPQWHTFEARMNRSNLARSMGGLVREGRLRAYQQIAFALEDVMSFGEVARAAVIFEQIPILNWMHNENTPSLLAPKPDQWVGRRLCDQLCNTAARHGQLETLKWLRAQQPPFFQWGPGIWGEALRGALEPTESWRGEPDHRPFIAVLDYALAQKCPGHDCSPRHNVGEIVDTVAPMLAQRLFNLLQEFGKPRGVAGNKERVDVVAAFVLWFRPMLPEEWVWKLDELLARTRQALPRPINARPPRWC